jgi:hypothetical protein
MRRHHRVFLVLALALCAVGCQALFTTSLAVKLARDPSAITIPATISTADATAILQTPNVSPAVLTNLLTVLNTQADLPNATTETKVLAVQTALAASNVSATVTAPLMSVATTALAGGTVSGESITTIVTSLQASAAVSGVVDNLKRIDDPVVLAQVTQDMSPTDLMMSALVLATSALPAGVTNPSDTSQMSSAQLSAFQADPAVVLASSLVKSASDALALSGGDPTMAAALQGFLSIPTTP